MGLFKREAICHDNKTRLRQTRRRDREIDEGFENLTLYFFTVAVVAYIEKYAPNNRCIQILEDVVSIIPSDSPWTARDSVDPTRFMNPETPFSASRTAPELVKSNAELIDILVSTARLRNIEAISIRGSITIVDSAGSNGKSGVLTMGTGLVSGGRLGRDHMLDDIPNHFVRDQLMNYIMTQLDEDNREEPKKAVFADLSTAELEQYSAIILQKRRDIELQERTGWEEARQAHLKREAQKAAEVANQERQESLIEEIDDTVDLTPKPDFAFRDYFKLPPISGSVINPSKNAPAVSGGARKEPEERDVEVSSDIDRDCDQIRAMIARFIKSSDWSVTQFRWALKSIRRPQLIAFLEKKGHSAGKQSMVFALAWEFFKKREMVGCTLPDISNAAGVLQERDGNRGRQRPSDSGDTGDTPRKRTRRS
ncbi:hypothetical protein GGR52DRAFT_102133 [Hypoxylon sp. FL1284]|nr:hypothetical protein GGR52DRAFT_102133 [Hypoxylon sp. FL1284]